ncbi:hypothetical protein XENOCAPTIV_006701, partial [Xenoophorus captivus]
RSFGERGAAAGTWSGPERDATPDPQFGRLSSDKAVRCASSSERRGSLSPERVYSDGSAADLRSA